MRSRSHMPGVKSLLPHCVEQRIAGGIAGVSHTADIIKVGIAGAGHTVENVKEGLVENVMASMAGASHVADHVMGGIQGALACTGHTVENMKGGLVRANQLADHVRGELEIGGIKFGNTVYQSEAPSTYSDGSWAAGSCAPGNKQSQWLHCGGYFKYAQ